MSATPAAGSTENRISAGFVAEGFEPVKALLDRYLLEDERYSAQLCAYWQGRRVIDLCGGPDMAADSLTGVFSSSKGVSALTLALLVDGGDLDLDERVAHYWPEFAANGKGSVLVRELLSHQAGLPGVDGAVTMEDFCESSGVAARLAAAMPAWRPGSAFGYHALTIGVFIEELFRRVAGESLQAVYRREYRDALGCDFFLGLPESEEHRYRDVLPLVMTPAQEAALPPQPGGPDSLGAWAFQGGGMDGGPLIPNVPVVRRAGVSAAGGVGSARGLATVYAAATTGVGGSSPTVSAATLRAMAQEQCWGIDRILHEEMAFGVVFMKPQPRIPFAGHRAFGHDGAGGALGFADPRYDLAFGYIPQRMAYPGGADQRGVALSEAVRRSIRNL